MQDGFLQDGYEWVCASKRMVGWGGQSPLRRGVTFAPRALLDFLSRALSSTVFSPSADDGLCTNSVPSCIVFLLLERSDNDCCHYLHHRQPSCNSFAPSPRLLAG